MNEISIFYDKELSKQIVENIVFEPIVAGESTKKEIFIKNNLLWLIDINNIDIVGEDVIIDGYNKTISPKSIGKIILLFKPKLTTFKPISVKLKINASYIVT